VDEYPTVPPEAVTRILNDARDGRTGAAEQLFQLVYDELRRLAASHMRGERPGHTLQATALVHEAFMRLVRDDQMDWRNRAHFFGAAAEAMRRILVDHARARASLRRGGDRRKVSLEDTPDLSIDRSNEVVAVDAALSRLSELDSRKGRLVELRFFGGLDIEEAAEVLGVSPRTVKRDWTFAKAWLYREIGDG